MFTSTVRRPLSRILQFIDYDSVLSDIQEPSRLAGAGSVRLHALLFFQQAITSMLLIACPECRREISGRPNLCPNCGVRLGEVVLKLCKLWLRIGKILAGFGAVLVISSLIDSLRSPFGPVGWLLVVVGLFLTIWAHYTSRQLNG